MVIACSSWISLIYKEHLYKKLDAENYGTVGTSQTDIQKI